MTLTQHNKASSLNKDRKIPCAQICQLRSRFFKICYSVDLLSAGEITIFSVHNFLILGELTRKKAYTLP
jgi:hypothetical protein